MGVFASPIALPKTANLGLISSTPNPTGNDITVFKSAASGVPAAEDFTIRDTTARDFVVPMAVSRYRQITVRWNFLTQFDKVMHLQCGFANSPTSLGGSIFANLLIPNSRVNNLTITATGPGPISVHGSGVIQEGAFILIPALAEPWNYLRFKVFFDDTPTAGTIRLYVVRSSL